MDNKSLMDVCAGLLLFAVSLQAVSALINLWLLRSSFEVLKQFTRVLPNSEPKEGWGANSSKSSGKPVTHRAIV
jgi:hypothetical protein